MPTRTFGSIDPERQKKAPLTFKLQGLYAFDVKDRSGKVTHSKGERWEETFTCLINPPAGVLDDLIATTGGGADGITSWDKASLVRFVKGVIVPEDEKRLDSVLRDKARPIDLQEDFGPLTLWLADQFGHPTAPPSS